MKPSITSLKKTEEKEPETEKKRRPFSLWRQAIIYYILMMILFIYFILANLSSAPKYIYTQY